MSERDSDDWSWRVDDRSQNEGLNLLYEPGTWGDLIKGAWAVRVARGLTAERGPLRVRDPYAGAVDYPLVAASAARIEELSPGDLRTLVEGFGERFPSTAALVERAVAPSALDVFDADRARRKTWQDRGGANVLDVASGDEALGSDHDLVLVDPYDLFERESKLVPRALAGPESQAVLFYLFNKAPRGASAHKRYLALRERVREHAGARRVLVGRIPSDAILPRAFHEILLVAPPSLVERVESGLREETLELSRRLSDAGAFEA